MNLGLSDNSQHHEKHLLSFYSHIMNLYTKILEVNLFAFAYRLFHEDFSPIDGALCDSNAS